ncbi:hypothetical protein CDL15_Pgr027220 [Punica granatum]|nr:hypothetical protein CDL15_Pgr027220 [Punica granatum]PKI51410.1 hypothetical protein CRG98_028206 [Punica granatum]
MRWAQRPGSLEGYGHAFVTSEEQKLDWNDILFLKTLPPDCRSYDLWPDNPSHFQRALETYTEEMRELAVSIVKYMVKGMMMTADGLEAADDGAEEDHNKLFCESLRRGNYDVRINCYPPCPQPERVMGITPHVDISAVTLLVECGNTPGLHVLKDGRWVIVPPVDGAILVNLGAIMQIFSNGIYKAPDHRAMVNKYKERLSIVTFCYPDPSLDIGPSKQLTGESARTPPIYKTVTNSDYFHHFFNLKQAHDPFLDSLKI